MFLKGSSFLFASSELACQTKAAAVLYYSIGMSHQAIELFPLSRRFRVWGVQKVSKEDAAEF